MRRAQRGIGSFFWAVEVEVRSGGVGLALIARDELIGERVLNAGQDRKTIYLPAAATEADLLVRNGPNQGPSQIAIYAVRLVQMSPIGNDEDLLLPAASGP